MFLNLSCLYICKTGISDKLSGTIYGFKVARMLATLVTSRRHLNLKKVLRAPAMEVSELK